MPSYAASCTSHWQGYRFVSENQGSCKLVMGTTGDSNDEYQIWMGPKLQFLRAKCIKLCKSVCHCRCQLLRWNLKYDWHSRKKKNGRFLNKAGNREGLNCYTWALRVQPVYPWCINSAKQVQTKYYIPLLFKCTVQGLTIASSPHHGFHEIRISSWQMLRIMSPDLFPSLRLGKERQVGHSV